MTFFDVPNSLKTRNFPQETRDASELCVTVLRPLWCTRVNVLLFVMSFVGFSFIDLVGSQDTCNFSKLSDEGSAGPKKLS